jgi:hypothetical protein
MPFLPAGTPHHANPLHSVQASGLRNHPGAVVEVEPARRPGRPARHGYRTITMQRRPSGHRLQQPSRHDGADDASKRPMVFLRSSAHHRPALRRPFSQSSCRAVQPPSGHPHARIVSTTVQEPTLGATRTSGASSSRPVQPPRIPSKVG